MRRFTAPGLLALSLALVACGQSSVAPAPEETAGTAQAETVRLTLQAPIGSGAATTAQGLPGGTGGLGPVDFLKVRVYDSERRPVTFDGRNVYAQGGPQDVLTLDAAHPSLAVVLPRGRYSFESIGKTAEDGTFLAYGWNKLTDLTGQNPRVNLDLHTLFDPGALRLNTLTPLSSAAAGDEFDLRLSVRTPENAGARFDVPLGDYEVSYAATAAEVLSGTGFGARVRVGAGAAVRVQATVTGWRATGAESAAQETATVTFEVPLSAGGVGADLEAPALTFDPAANLQQGQEVTLSGTVSDVGSGVASVAVHDGVTPIGRENGADGVAPVVFELGADGRPTGRWTLKWTPNRAGEHELTAVSTDLRGNESRRTQTLTVAAPPRPAYDGLFTLTGDEPSVSSSPLLEPGAEYWLKVDMTALASSRVTVEVEAWSGPASEFTVTYGPTREGATLPTTLASGAYAASVSAPGVTWVRIVNTSGRAVQVTAYAYQQ